MRRLFLLLNALLMNVVISAAAETDCPEYYLNATVTNQLLHFSLSGHQASEPYVDTIRIFAAGETENPEIATHAQGDQYIDISKLDRGYYSLRVNVGGCEYSRIIFKRQEAVAREWDICSFETEVIKPHSLRFSIAVNDAQGQPLVDSLWIVGLMYNNQSPSQRVYMKTSAQSGDTIDIQPLFGNAETDYQIIAWINGMDYYSNSFYYCGACEEYNNVHAAFTVITPHHVVMNITNGSMPVPPMDSLWVTTYFNHSASETLLSGVFQNGDTIDLEPLVGRKDAQYTVWMQFGDCIKKGSFEFSGLEYDYCLAADIHGIHIETSYQEDKIQYYLLDYDYRETYLPVDSIWIQTYDMETNTSGAVVYSSRAQPGEDISVSALKNEMYNLFVKIGDCELSQIFYKSWKTQAIQDVPVQDEKTIKILNDGHLYILREDKRYTLLGQSIISR